MENKIRNYFHCFKLSHFPLKGESSYIIHGNSTTTVDLKQFIVVNKLISGSSDELMSFLIPHIKFYFANKSSKPHFLLIYRSAYKKSLRFNFRSVTKLKMSDYCVIELNNAKFDFNIVGPLAEDLMGSDELLKSLYEKKVEIENYHNLMGKSELRKLIKGRYWDDGKILLRRQKMLKIIRTKMLGNILLLN